jgi:LysR family glycine cleavage system transcriptional activator
VIEAAIAGIGFAILPDFLVRNELESGELVRAHGRHMVCEHKYYVVYPDKYANHNNIRDFVRWLKEEVKDI